MYKENTSISILASTNAYSGDCLYRADTYKRVCKTLVAKKNLKNFISIHPLMIGHNGKSIPHSEIRVLSTKCEQYFTLPVTRLYWLFCLCQHIHTHRQQNTRNSSHLTKQTHHSHKKNTKTNVDWLPVKDLIRR